MNNEKSFQSVKGRWCYYTSNTRKWTFIKTFSSRSMVHWQWKLFVIMYFRCQKRYKVASTMNNDVKKVNLMEKTDANIPCAISLFPIHICSWNLIFQKSWNITGASIFNFKILFLYIIHLVHTYANILITRCVTLKITISYIIP